MRKKFILWKLGSKIINFANIRRNNNTIYEKKRKKNAHFKSISYEKSQTLLIFDKIVAYIAKNFIFKMNQLQESS